MRENLERMGYTGIRLLTKAESNSWYRDKHAMPVFNCTIVYRMTSLLYFVKKLFQSLGLEGFFACFGLFLLHVICPWALVLKLVLSMYIV